MAKFKASSLTAEHLRRVIDYDKDTGVFVWKISPTNGTPIGRVAGSISNFGYERISICGKSYQSHRLAWLYVNGYWPKVPLDHINGTLTDNRISNLREATQQQNMANQHRLRKNNTSGLRGVSWRKGSNRWRAVIKVGKKQISLGDFYDKEAAKAAYDTALLKYFGEYANTSV